MAPFAAFVREMRACAGETSCVYVVRYAVGVLGQQAGIDRLTSVALSLR